MKKNAKIAWNTTRLSFYLIPETVDNLKASTITYEYE